MRLDDLVNGMIVELTNGDRLLVVDDQLLGFGYVMNKKDYEDDLSYAEVPAYNIVKIYTIKRKGINNLTEAFDDENLSLMWKGRFGEVIEFDPYETDIIWSLYNLGFEFVARDLDGELHAFVKRPSVTSEAYGAFESKHKLPTYIFRHIEFENGIVPLSDLMKHISIHDHTNYKVIL